MEANFVNAGSRAGVELWKIQQVSWHTTLQVLSGTVRDAHLFDNHAGTPFQNQPRTGRMPALGFPLPAGWAVL